MRPHVDHSAARASSHRDSPEAEGGAGTAAALGGLEGLIGFALRRAQLVVFDETIRSIADLDLRLAQFSVLALVAHRPGLNQSAAAAALGIQRANFVALIDGLEKRGLARRTSDPSDRRCHALLLTAEGERVLEEARARVAAVEARLDAKLGADGRERLLAMLWRLARD